ncbi:hypothetical protein [Microbacterium alcoholitolerans]|uniref:hypothetical protein n=1 Tax=Microbacterium sp. YY-04 TaxID=3421637 RepID=UPI003D173EB2
MSNPVEGENGDAKAAPPPETGATSPESAVSDASAASPESAVSDAISEAAAAADAPPLTADDVADVEIPDAEIPAPAVPDPEIPDPVLPASVLDAPVIPPAAAAGEEDPVPATRTARRTLPSVDSLPKPAPIPRDPAVVPPASGATPGNYRGWTIAIFSILFLLLSAAFATIGVLLGTGADPFPSAEVLPAAAAPVPGWVSPVG